MAFPPLSNNPKDLKRRLLQAAADDNLASFKGVAAALAYLKGGGSRKDAVEEVRDCGAGAVHVAAGRGRMSVLKYLVEELRLDVNPTDGSGDTPLAYAVRGGGVGCVRYLLDHGANPDNPNDDGFTPLHLASIRGDCEIAKALLSKGAHVDQMSKNLGAPLHVAASCNQDGVMKILLDHHADCNKLCHPVYTPLFMAINAKSLKCAELLIKAGADVKGVGTITPLILVANNGLTDFYKCLLDAGADPDFRDDFGHLPIEIAAYNNRRKDVEILLPVTSRIPFVEDWSVDGVINYVKSLPSVEKDPMYKLSPADMKSEGNKAYKSKDYFNAVKLYSMALNFLPDDPTLYSNRCLCWIKMREGVQALMDAQVCRMKKPDWPKACYLEGASHILLKDYEKACDAFFDGLKMDPWNVEIAEALRGAFESLKISRAAEKDQ